MASRSLVAVGILSTLLLPGRSWAEGPPGRPENVIIVTLDGFRPQEFFAGADERLIDAKAGGVPDPDDLKRRYWRQTAEARREALLPFIWTTVAQDRPSLRRPFAECPRDADQRPEVLVSRLQRDLLRLRRPADRLERQEAEPEPIGPGIPQRAAPVSGPRRGDRHLGRLPFIFRSRENGLFVHAGWVPIADRAAERPSAPGQPDDAAAAALLAGQRLRRDHDGGRERAPAPATPRASCTSGWARRTSGPTSGVTISTWTRPMRPTHFSGISGPPCRRGPSIATRRPSS